MNRKSITLHSTLGKDGRERSYARTIEWRGTQLTGRSVGLNRLTPAELCEARRLYSAESQRAP